jgi:rhodanese-related sulfurtransferase
MKSLLLETGKVLIVGLVVAWLANRVSPRGLHLGRDYFSDPRLRVVSPESPSPRPHAAEASHRVSEINSDQALGFFRESRRRPGEVIFVDARKESSFLEGHVPDAYPLDRFYPDTSLPAVVMAGGTADIVVVYCAGGTCEDSHYAALQLLEAGLQESRVRVYAGGFNDWTAQHRPVERGARGSGLITDPLP